MSKKIDIEEKAWTLLSEMTEGTPIKPVDCEYVKQGGDYSLLVYIDKENGVTVEDCEQVSRSFETILDEKDFIPDAYTLVVSSPGLGRTIKRPRDFVFAMGKEIEFSTYREINGYRDFVGILKDFDKNTVTVEFDDETITFNKKDISIIKLTFDI
ncbi:MAG: ribosome maturation factor RimP [Lachnospiraceae bacterium]